MSSPLLLLITLTAALVESAQSKTFHVLTGVPLERLPGHVASQGQQPEAKHIDISLVDLKIKGPAGPDGTPLVSFTTKAYKSNGKDRARPFGPTLRVRRGDSFSITLTNDLVAGPGENATAGMPNHLSLPSHTNLHTHGLWGDPGVRAQPSPGVPLVYQGHDNIFVGLSPRPNASVPHGDSIKYTYTLPHNHMPGFGWYHPHFHRSSGLQTATAKGVIIVEGEEEFLPEGDSEEYPYSEGDPEGDPVHKEGPKKGLKQGGGCGALRRVLFGGGSEGKPRLKEWVMQIEGWFFKGTATEPTGSIQSSPAAEAAAAASQTATSTLKTPQPDSFDSYPDLSARSDPPNPTCCGGEGQGKFESAGLDFLTVNGGYHPLVRMQAGVWQRWRLIYTAYMRYLDLTWTTPQGSPAPCELQLLAKDGVYLQQIPRQVAHVLLPPGGRADLLVRCEASAGTRLAVRSGFGPMSALPSMCDQPTCRVMQQEVVVEVEVEGSGEGIRSSEIPQEECRPLRPAHLADLREEALAAAGVNSSQIAKGSIMFFPATMGDMAGVCTVNGDLFSFPDSNPLVAPLGKVVEWALMQTGIHPHHLHTVPMQIVGLPDITRGRAAAAAGGGGGSMAGNSSSGGGSMAGNGGSIGSSMAGSGGSMAGSGGSMAGSTASSIGRRRLRGGDSSSEQQLLARHGGGSGSEQQESRSLEAGSTEHGDESAGQQEQQLRRLQQLSRLSERSRAHFEMMRSWGIQQAAAGMSPENEAAWAELTSYFKVGDYHDTLLLPVPGPSGGAATVRFQPGHWTGYSVHHCHYLQHEDGGCMKIVKWQCPGYEGNEQPTDCQFQFPVPGTLPFGPDGGPVAQ